jgi:large subunit ribosomal protein L21
LWLNLEDPFGQLDLGLGVDALMYAIISDGGRQYRVEEGQEFDIDYRDISKGNQLQFGQVLALSDQDGLRVGKPNLEGASVTAQVVGVRFGEKLVVQKLRRRKNSRRKTGHRQMYTTVRVEKINAPEQPAP